MRHIRRDVQIPPPPRPPMKRETSKDSAGLKGQIEAWSQTQPECQRLVTISGIGMLTASALVTTIGDARDFQSWQ